MSIKVERQLHDMRILGRIVGVRSTEQFVRHLLPPHIIKIKVSLEKQMKQILYIRNTYKKYNNI